MSCKHNWDDKTIIKRFGVDKDEFDICASSCDHFVEIEPGVWGCDKTYPGKANIPNSGNWRC